MLLRVDHFHQSHLSAGVSPQIYCCGLNCVPHPQGDLTKSKHPVVVSVALFGSRVLADIMKLGILQ